MKPSSRARLVRRRTLRTVGLASLFAGTIAACSALLGPPQSLAWLF